MLLSNEPAKQGDDLACNLVIQCNDDFTGSFGCLLKQNSHSLVSSLLTRGLWKHFDCYDMFSTPYEKKYKVPLLDLLQFINIQSGSLALKVIRASFKNTSNSSSEVFAKEVINIKTVYDFLGQDRFNDFTTYVMYGGSCAFALQLHTDSNMRLYMSHKPNHEKEPIDCIYFTLQESCLMSLKVLAQAQTFKAKITDLFCKDIMASLAALHHAGVVHGDIKPENIVYCPFSRGRKFKLVDFGSAFGVKGQLPHQVPPNLTGTKMYMSPFYMSTVLQTVHPIVRQSIKALIYSLSANSKDSSHRHKVSKYVLELVRIHLLGIRRSQLSDDVQFIMYKNDEYAFTMTLLYMYVATGNKALLQNATSIALACPLYFTTWQ